MRGWGQRDFHSLYYGYLQGVTGGGGGFVYLFLGWNHEQTDESFQNIFYRPESKLKRSSNIHAALSILTLTAHRLTDLAAAQVHELDQRVISTLIHTGDSTYLRDVLLTPWYISLFWNDRLPEA